VRNDVCRLVGIEVSGTERGLDLILQLGSAKLDALGWIEFGHKYPYLLLSKVLGDAAEVVNSKFPAKTQNSVNQNDIHGKESYHCTRNISLHARGVSTRGPAQSIETLLPF
jgi:hypothetical protein